MDEFNPYAAPQAPRSDILVPEDEEGRGVWRDGSALVMSRFARLPSRCVKCNEPATSRLKRTLAWVPPAFYWLLPFAGIIYLVVYYSYRETARIEVPLCALHRARRRGRIVQAWIVAIAGFACFFLAESPQWGEDFEAITVLGGLVLIGWAIFISFSARVVRPLLINKTHIWLKGVGPAYLDSLPELPRPEAEF